MNRIREKILTSWSPLVTVIAVVALCLGLAVGPFISNLRAFSTAIAAGNTHAIQITLLGLILGLLTTGVMFCVARSWAITDALHKGDEKTERLSSQINAESETLTKHAAELVEGFGNLQATVQRLVIDTVSKTTRIVEDSVVLWRSPKDRLITFNGTLASHEVEIQPMKGGQMRILANEDVLRDNWLSRKAIEMRFVVFVPRRLGFGNHPAYYFLRLVHLVRVTRTLDPKGDWSPSIRVYLVDAPRPVSSFFITNKERGGKVVPYGLEYFRSVEPGSVSTPTSSRMLLEHTSPEAVRGLEECVQQALKQSVEISFDELENIIGPMLPTSNGGSVPQIPDTAWRSVVESLYGTAEREKEEASQEMVANGDSFAIHYKQNTPSLYDYTKRPIKPVTEPSKATDHDTAQL